MQTDTVAVEQAMLPCPFCGGGPAVHFSHESGQWDVYEVECPECQITKWSPHGLTADAAKQAAITAWNTRLAALQHPGGGVDLAAGEAARFTITVRNDGSTTLATKASGEISPFILLDKAIAAILAERVDAARCPAHLETTQPPACPFCGCEHIYAEKNPQGTPWLICTNRNCGGQAPEALWRARVAPTAPHGPTVEITDELIAIGAKQMRAVLDDYEPSRDAGPWDDDTILASALEAMGLNVGESALRALPAAGEESLSDDVRRLVIAAREAWELGESSDASMMALDKALEAFSERVPYENEPGWEDLSTPIEIRRPIPPLRSTAEAGEEAKCAECGGNGWSGGIVRKDPELEDACEACGGDGKAKSTPPADLAECREVLEPHVFLDCDGVLADFDTYAEAYFGMEPRAYEAKVGSAQFWQELEAKGDFYRNLPLMPDAMELYEAVKHLHPTILTGCPRGNWAQGQKVAWAAEHFPGVPIITCRSADKRDYAKPGDVLIDDWAQHRHRWIEMGGVFITHHDAASSIAALRAHYPALLSKLGTK